jgi:hypothetical protein
MNYWIIGAAVVALIVAFVLSLGKKKAFCTASIFETMNKVYVKHDGVYNCHVKTGTNQSKEKRIYWTEITKQGGIIDDIKEYLGMTKPMLWRPINHKDTISTKGGKRHINLLWLGKNDFRVMKPHVTDWEIIDIKDKALDVSVARVKKQQNINLEVIDDEDHYFLASIYDQLDTIYRKQNDLWDNIKPFILPALIMFCCIIAIYLTAKTNSESGEKYAQAFGKAVESNDNYGKAIMDYINKQNIPVNNDPDTVRNKTGGGTSG